MGESKSGDSQYVPGGGNIVQEYFPLDRKQAGKYSRNHVLSTGCIMKRYRVHVRAGSL